MTQPKHYPPRARTLTIALALTLCASLAWAEDYFVAHGVRVIDGDTIAAERYDLPYGISLTNVRIRALGYDAWEVTGDEHAKGAAASVDFRGLLDRGTLYAIPQKHERHRDNFGRLLARLVVRSADGSEIDAREYMRERGHTK